MNEPAALEELRGNGILRVPVVTDGTRWVNAGDLDAVAELLKLSPTGHRMLPPEDLMQRYDRILAQAQHYLAAFPQDRMSMTVPRRERRDMRQLGYHIFAIAENLMHVKPGEDYNQGNGPVPASVQSFGDIVRYGDGVREELQRWFAAQNAATWNEKLNTTYGDFALHRYFERATWHSAQHLRQVVEMLRLAGENDIAPLPAGLFEGLPIPEQLWE